MTIIYLKLELWKQENQKKKKKRKTIFPVLVGLKKMD